jgi:hypothetical protein
MEGLASSSSKAGPLVAHFGKAPDPFQGVAVGGTDIAAQARFVGLAGDDNAIPIRFAAKDEKLHGLYPLVLHAQPPWRALIFIRSIKAPAGIDIDQPRRAGADCRDLFLVA